MKALDLTGKWIVVLVWCGLCLVTSPLWFGAVLAWLHRVLSAISAFVIRWGFWEPTQRSWRGLVVAYHRAKARADVMDAEEAARLQHAADFKRKAKRSRRGGR